VSTGAILEVIDIVPAHLIRHVVGANYIVAPKTLVVENTRRIVINNNVWGWWQKG